MRVQPFPPEPMRAALRTVLPEHDQLSREPREPQFTYVPPSHAQALNLDSTVVEGMRGAGKSHWWACLNSPEHRRYLEDSFPETRIRGNIEVSQGFGVGVAPTKDVLADLQRDLPPRHIWQAVIGVHAGLPAPFPSGQDGWRERVQWVRDHPEEFGRLLDTEGQSLSKAGRKRLILFDALDRLADDWAGIRPLVRALFQLALDLLASPGFRFKLFVRPDMLADTEILAFPDSSKLLARKAALTWKRADLYALLFQCLANEKAHGQAFRDHCTREFALRWKESGNHTWILPNQLRSDESIQKEVFHALAGPAMASGEHGHKRGFPYTWLPNHLVDSRDQVSPRSFFAALRAASITGPRSDWQYALHFRDIQTGVQQASQIRVQEAFEDYPWVKPLMEPLRGLTVPCTSGDVARPWTADGVVDKLRRLPGQLQATDVRLLPPHFEQGQDGLLRDLEDLGIIRYLSDGRIQMPDVYRIAFGLGRKGGVKPLR